MPLCSKSGEVKYVRKVRFISYPAGVYDPGTRYTCTSAAGPFVELDGQYYAMYKEGTWLGSSIGRTPKEDYAQYGKNATWQLMDKYKAIVTEMLFADYAKLGSAVFLDDYMFSQYGVNASGASTNAYQNFNPATLGQSGCKFTPNLYIDWVKGQIVSNIGKFKGDITATSGKIGGWSISGNDLVCSGYNTRILVEASGSRFMRINAEEKIMCYIRSDSSTGISVAVYGNTTDSIGIKALCNAQGSGYAIKGYGNVLLEARQGEYIELHGCAYNMRKVSSTSSLQTNDDYIEFTNAKAITFDMTVNRKSCKRIYMKKVTTGADVTLKGSFRNPDGVGVTTNLTIGDEKSRIFLFNGTYWVQFYCG